MSGIIGGAGSKSGVIGHTESKGMVLLETYTASNDATKDFVLSNYRTYNEYKIVLNAITPASSGSDLRMWVGTSSSSFAASTDDYRVGIRRTYYGGSGQTLTDVDGSQHTMLAHTSSVNNASGRGVMGFINLYNPRNSSAYTGANLKYFSYTSNNNIYMYTGGGVRMANEDNTHVRFEWNNSNLQDGSIILYGIRDA